MFSYSDDAYKYYIYNECIARRIIEHAISSILQTLRVCLAS